MLAPGSVINFTRRHFNDGDWQGVVEEVVEDRYRVKVQEASYLQPKYFSVKPEDIQEVVSEPEVKDEKSNGRVGTLEKSIAKHETSIKELRKQITEADAKTAKSLQSKITAHEKVIAERRKQIEDIQADEV